MTGVVKLKFEYSKQKIKFLDVEIIIENGRLETNLFVKPTNLQLLFSLVQVQVQIQSLNLVLDQS